MVRDMDQYNISSNPLKQRIITAGKTKISTLSDNQQSISQIHGFKTTTNLVTQSISQWNKTPPSIVSRDSVSTNEPTIRSFISNSVTASVDITSRHNTKGAVIPPAEHQMITFPTFLSKIIPDIPHAFANKGERVVSSGPPVINANNEGQLTTLPPCLPYAIRENTGDLSANMVSGLWVPHLFLTLAILALLIASFLRFHIKNRNRYQKRQVKIHEQSDVQQKSRAVIIFNTHTHATGKARSGLLSKNIDTVSSNTDMSEVADMEELGAISPFAGAMQTFSDQISTGHISYSCSDLAIEDRGFDFPSYDTIITHAEV